jgi:exopolysaccharide production protein ExoZ
MLNNVQVLRAVAAFGVVLVHVALFDKPLLGRALEFGRYGVDLFFVISGFVMVYTVARRPLGPGQFFLNRLIRIVPLYWALTLAVFTVALVAPQLLKATTADPVDLVKSLLFIPYRKSNGLMHPVLFPGWTLNYEMFFYALFALSLFIKRPVISVIAVVGTLAALVVAGVLLKPTSDVARFYTSPLLLEFGYGMIIGLIFPWLQRQRGLAILAGTMVAVGLGTIALLPLAVEIRNQALVIGLPATVAVAGALMLEVEGKRVSSPTLLLLGAASYALYLVHPFVVEGVREVADRLGLLGVPFGLVVAVVVGTAGALFAGVALHLLLERPVDQWLRRRLGTYQAPGRIRDSLALWPWKHVGRDP